jgi:hypothetical protein
MGAPDEEPAAVRHLAANDDAMAKTVQDSLQETAGR